MTIRPIGELATASLTERDDQEFLSATVETHASVSEWTLTSDVVQATITTHPSVADVASVDETVSTTIHAIPDITEAGLVAEIAQELASAGVDVETSVIERAMTRELATIGVESAPSILEHTLANELATLLVDARPAVSESSLVAELAQSSVVATPELVEHVLAREVARLGLRTDVSVLERAMTRELARIGVNVDPNILESGLANELAQLTVSLAPSVQEHADGKESVRVGVDLHVDITETGIVFDVADESVSVSLTVQPSVSETTLGKEQSALGILTAPATRETSLTTEAVKVSLTPSPSVFESVVEAPTIPDYIQNKARVWYPMGAGSGTTVTDETENGHDGIRNGTDWITNGWVDGHAIENENASDNSGDFIESTTWGDFFSNADQDFWLAFTVQTTDRKASGTNGPMLFGESHRENEAQWLIAGIGTHSDFFGDSPDQIGLSLRDDDGDVLNIEADPQINDGEQYRVVMNKVANTGAGAIEIYIDGEQVSTTVNADQGFASGSNVLDDFQHPVYLFAENNEGDYWRGTEGILDDFIVGEPGTTLTEAEISEDLDRQPWHIDDEQLEADGGWNYRDRPVAMVHDGVLYYVFIDTNGDQKVASLDLSTDDTASSTIESTTDDLHNNPAIFINDAEHIGAFVYPYDGFGEDDITRWRMSSNPKDVGTFDATDSYQWVGSNNGKGRSATYGKDSSGNIYMNNHISMQPDPLMEFLLTSTDGGDTWTQNELWQLGSSDWDDRNYTTFWVEGDEIHFVANPVNHDPDPSASFGVYYVKYNTTDDEFQRADGTKAFDFDDTPVQNTSDFDAIFEYDEEGNNENYAFWSDIKAAPDGTPYITFGVYPDDVGRPNVEHTGYWSFFNGSSWEFHEVVDMGLGFEGSLHPSGITLDPRDMDSVFSVVDVGSGDTQIQKLTTPDGGSTWAISDILSEPQDAVFLPFVPHGVRNDPGSVECLWLEGTLDGWENYNTSIHLKR